MQKSIQVWMCSVTVSEMWIIPQDCIITAEHWKTQEQEDKKKKTTHTHSFLFVLVFFCTHLTLSTA